MKCIIQRVLSANISIEGKLITGINRGLLVLVGYTHNDNERIIEDLVNKIINIRIFDDNDNKLNLSVLDIQGEILLVPNFTIYADTSHGRRPDFTSSAKSEISKPLFDFTCSKLKKLYNNSYSGIFGENMQVNLINDGPLTVILENKKEIIAL